MRQEQHLLLTREIGNLLHAEVVEGRVKGDPNHENDSSLPCELLGLGKLKRGACEGGEEEPSTHSILVGVEVLASNASIEVVALVGEGLDILS